MTTPRTRRRPRRVVPAGSAAGSGVQRQGGGAGLALLGRENHRRGVGRRSFWEMSLRIAPRKDGGRRSVSSRKRREATHLSFKLPGAFWNRKQ